MPELKEDKFYQDILSSIQDGIIVVSKDCKVLEINAAAEKICNISAVKACTLTIEDVLSCNQHLLDLTKKTLAAGSSHIDIEYKFFNRKSLHRLPLSVVISPLMDNSGNASGAVIILRDVTLLKELEENINRTERMAAIGTLAANMAHEIKNPLGGIKGASQLLRGELDDKGLCEYLDVIVKEVNRINKIVEYLLTFSRPKKPEPCMINIHKVIKDVLLLQKESKAGKGVVIRQNYDPSIPAIHADENQIVQVFLNIIKNSLEAMPEGGDLTITTKIFSDYHMLSPGTRETTKIVLIEIRDTGCGISEEQLKYLFTPFFSTKSQGSGLGLAISNHIIEAHNGRIKILSNQDSTGTTVQVFLPLKQYI